MILYQFDLIGITNTYNCYCYNYSVICISINVVDIITIVMNIIILFSGLNIGMYELLMIHLSFLY